MLSILLVAGLAGALPLSSPGVAYACSCRYEPDGPNLVEHVSIGASVFTGTVTAERIEDRTRFYDFAVREVFKGDVAATTVVSSSVDSASCGRSFDVGVEYLVFTSTYATAGARWAADSCAATTESANQRTRDAVLTVYGAPRAPDPRTDAGGAYDTAADDQGVGNSGHALLWFGLAVASAIALTAALRRWRTRSSKSAN
ncbi:hypothetical protein [Rhodococcus sp. Q]|uniref:hypothetical protein n=1 Tax=Rhodococcus sp. Q TaxID=2502252 RepID=UPI0010FA591A|nr:hypothetical protein [Rhodococcus sp. Q]